MTDQENGKNLLAGPGPDSDIYETLDELGDEKFYNTPQAAELIGVPHTTLRGWFIELEEKYEVHSLPRNSRGRRIFRKEDIEIALAIKEMREKNFTFEVIVEVLKKRFADTLHFNPNYARRPHERAVMYYEQLTRTFRDEILNFMEDLQIESEKRIKHELWNIKETIQNYLNNNQESLSEELENWKTEIEEKIRIQYEIEQQKLLERVQDLLDNKAKEYKEREQKLLDRINQLVEEREKEKKGGFLSRLFGGNKKDA